MNPHRVLGIDENATREEITAAYRSLAKTCHPDLVQDDPASTARFMELTEAYRKLVSSDGKQKHSPTDPRHKAPKKPKNATRIVTVSVSEAVSGKTVRIEGSPSCDRCGGEGTIRSQSPHACHCCGGSGISGYKERGVIRVKVACPHCAGSGRTMKIECEQCQGFGVGDEEDFEFDLPAGCVQGERFTISGAAGDPAAGTVGDMDIVVRIADDKAFRVVGSDVESVLVLPVWDAALGCARTLNGPDGRRFRLGVPPGTKHGKRFRLKGQGLGRGEDRGDFVIITDIAVPKATEGTAKSAFTALKLALEG